MKPFTILSALMLSLIAVGYLHAEPRVIRADVCVYGATPSRILAAIAARRQKLRPDQ